MLKFDNVILNMLNITLHKVIFANEIYLLVCYNFIIEGLIELNMHFCKIIRVYLDFLNFKGYNNPHYMGIVLDLYI